MITYKVTSVLDLPKITHKILALLNDNKKKVVVFYGEMGAGKTTLIKQLCKQMGVVDNIQSPTFSIVNQYVTLDFLTIYHFDFYRITNEEEALDIGIEEYFYSNEFCFIEWPEKIPHLLPENFVKITLTVQANKERLITIAF